MYKLTQLIKHLVEEKIID